MSDEGYDEFFAESARRSRERRGRRDERRLRRSGPPWGTGRRFSGATLELQHLLEAPGGRGLIGLVALIAVATADPACSLLWSAPWRSCSSPWC